MQAPSLTVVEVDCPSCRTPHRGVELKRLQRSSELYDKDGDGPYDYWAICPTTGDPILLHVKET